MKAVNILFIVTLFITACSSPKKTPAKEPVPTVSRAETLRGGTSFSNAAIMQVKTEKAGLNEESKWLSTFYPGYELIRKTQATRSSRHYDIFRIKTKQGEIKEVYFDTTSFWGKD
jgi:hypothetical protein